MGKRKAQIENVDIGNTARVLSFNDGENEGENEGDSSLPQINEQESLTSSHCEEIHKQDLKERVSSEEDIDFKETFKV